MLGQCRPKLNGTGRTLEKHISMKPEVVVHNSPVLLLTDGNLQTGRLCHGRSSL